MVKTVLICIAYILTTLTGMMLIKSGYESTALFHVPVIGTGISLKTLMGILLYGISFLIYVLFITRLKVSIVIPVVSGLYCALTVVIGIMLFKEQVSNWQIIGIGFIILGTVIVGIMEKTGR